MVDPPIDKSLVDAAAILLVSFAGPIVLRRVWKFRVAS
jgi:hypothetical protein